MNDQLLVVNVGSGTVGCAVFDLDRLATDGAADGGPERAGDGLIWHATLVHHHDPPQWRRGFDGSRPAADAEESDDLPGGVAALAEAVVEELKDCADSIVAVVHRIVHGGPDLIRPAIIDDAVRRRIEEASHWAPLHGASALRLVDDFAAQLPDALPIAVFDTAFHHTIPDWASIYGGPYEWFEHGLRRYGFHGISVEDAVRRVGSVLPAPVEDKRIVVAHLGGGCSVTAVRNGRSVDTTMGFTPTDGLLMAERSGSVDPGLLLHVMKTQDRSPSDVDRLLNEHSGLAGLSGVSGDLGEVARRARAGHERSRLAYGAYRHAVQKAIGAMAVSAGGIDALALTGGAIESAPTLQEELCRGLEHLGIEIDARSLEVGLPQEQRGVRTISPGDADTVVVVVPAAEERAMARTQIGPGSFIGR